MGTQKLLFFIAFFSLLFFSSRQNIDSLTEARNKLAESNMISYIETAYFPVPETDLVNVMNIKTELLYDKSDALGYNFIQSTEGEGLVPKQVIYQQGELKILNHKDRTVRMFIPEQYAISGDFKKIVKQNFRDSWSPMALLQEEWTFNTDTIMNGSLFNTYYRVEKEYVYDGIQIRTEHHIFINSKTFLLERSERRNYNNGILSQQVVREYSNYDLSQNKTALTYDLPANYVSVFGEKEPLEGLKIGDRAPEFNSITIDGDSVSLRSFRGKKVLLDFSVINCGYCMMALNHFNQEDYVLTDEVPIFYITPEDDETRMRTYMESKPIPFPVIADAEDIGKKYRLNSYPRFFLINEEGIIEKIQVGYSKDFIDLFRE